MFVWARNIFCPKVDRVGQKLPAPPLGSQKMRKSSTTPVVQPPRNRQAVLPEGGGARVRSTRGGKTCKNDRANRPRCAQVEQLKPSGTIRRAICAGLREHKLLPRLRADCESRGDSSPQFPDSGVEGRWRRFGWSLRGSRIPKRQPDHHF